MKRSLAVGCACFGTLVKETVKPNNTVISKLTQIIKTGKSVENNSTSRGLSELCASERVVVVGLVHLLACLVLVPSTC